MVCEKQKRIWNKKASSFLLSFILLLQAAFLIFMAGEKEYFHMDEAYSYGLMNYPIPSITDDGNFYDQWHNKEYYTDYLAISEDEFWNWRPVYENQKNDVHPPLYYLFLRLFASFTPGFFSQWTGIILNIICSLLCSILVYYISVRLMQSHRWALLTTFVSAFILSAVEMALYIRMYNMLALFILLITFLHLKYLQKHRLKLRQYILFTVVFALGSLLHYHFIIYCAVLFIAYIVTLKKQKNFVVLKRYILSVLAAVGLSLLIFPHSITHIFFGYRGVNGITGQGKLLGLIDSVLQYLQIVGEKLLNGFWIFIAIIIVCILLKNKHSSSAEKKHTEIWTLFISAAVYFLVIAASTPFKELRYIMPVCPILFICFMYALQKIFQSRFTAKTSFISVSAIMALMLIFPLFTGTQPAMQYKKYDHIAQRIQTTYTNVPALYIYNTDENRFLDDIYLFTLLDNSYILRKKDVTVQNLTLICNRPEMDKGMILFCNDGVDDQENIQRLMELKHYTEQQFLQKMNACKIYYLYNPDKI